MTPICCATPRYIITPAAPAPGTASMGIGVADEAIARMLWCNVPTCDSTTMEYVMGANFPHYMMEDATIVLGDDTPASLATAAMVVLRGLRTQFVPQAEVIRGRVRFVTGADQGRHTEDEARAVMLLAGCGWPLHERVAAFALWLVHGLPVVTGDCGCDDPDCFSAGTICWDYTGVFPVGLEVSLGVRELDIAERWHALFAGNAAA